MSCIHTQKLTEIDLQLNAKINLKILWENTWSSVYGLDLGYVIKAQLLRTNNELIELEMENFVF